MTPASSEEKPRIAAEIISQDLEARVLREFPSELLSLTLDQIRALASAGDIKARRAIKLLTDGRFKKG